MATHLEKIEHLEYWWQKDSDNPTPWRTWNKSGRKYLKKQRARYWRRKGVDQEVNYKMYKGWEY